MDKRTDTPPVTQ